MGRKPNLVRWIAAILGTSVFVAFPCEVIAGMAVSPIQQWVTVKPGKQETVTVIVTNADRGPETKPCTVSVEVVDFTVSPQGKLSFVKEARHSRSAVDWLEFDSSPFVLQPGESKKLEGKVSAPASADGDYWAAVLVKLGNPQEPKGNVAVRLQTASGIFIHVARRNYIERGTVTDANVVMPEFAPVGNFTEEPAWNQTSEEIQNKRVLKVNAELENDGLVAFLANGKARLYSENWRRVASIPMYTNRRRIFPTHSRRFIGVMSQPIPAGKYKLQLVFEPTSSRNGSSTTKHSRKITKDIELVVSDDLAQQWNKNFTDDGIQILDVEPQELNLSLNPGRFTTKRFQAISRGLSTVSVRCRIEADGQIKDWVALKSADFALAANMRRSVLCWVRIAPDAEPGRYCGTICVEAERSGLTAQHEANVEVQKIPIAIVISEPDKYAAIK
jgi:hypothetical protein